MKRRLGFFLIVGAAVSLVAVSTAWACGVLATLKANTKTAAPGATVGLSGEHYGSPTSNTAVSIRLNSRTATPIGTATPNSAGVINTNVALPGNLSPGWYVILATQNRTSGGNDTGVPKSGTPGRTTLRVQGAAAARNGGGVAVTPWGPGSKPTGGSGAALAVNAGSSSSSAFLPTLLGIVLSLGLLGTGVTLVARTRASRPQLGA